MCGCVRERVCERERVCVGVCVHASECVCPSGVSAADVVVFGFTDLRDSSSSRHASLQEALASQSINH